MLRKGLKQTSQGCLEIPNYVPYNKPVNFHLYATQACLCGHALLWNSLSQALSSSDSSATLPSAATAEAGLWDAWPSHPKQNSLLSS